MPKQPTIETRYPSFSAIFKAIPIEAKEEVLQTFRTNGGTFGKWGKTDQYAMVNSITHVEDRLEMKRKEDLLPIRMSLKAIRRSLEDSLDPYP